MELLVIPADPSVDHNITVQLGSTTLISTSTASNLGIVFDEQLSFPSISTVMQVIKKIGPLLSEYVTQLVVQALVISRLDYCNTILASLLV